MLEKKSLIASHVHASMHIINMAHRQFIKNYLLKFHKKPVVLYLASLPSNIPLEEACSACIGSQHKIKHLD